MRVTGTAALTPADGPAEPAWSPTPLAELEASVVSTRGHFVRDHFPVPSVDAASWSLRIDGAERSLVLGLADLRGRRTVTLPVVLECAGHRRLEFEPHPPGLPWGCGAVAEATWTGTPLAALLGEAGVPAGAREVVLEGADRGAFPGMEGEHRFARGLPLHAACGEDVLLAWAMNGEPIPGQRGGPVRAIVPGWYATESIKWLTRVWFSSQPFQGPFEALDYRLQAPGEPGPGRRLMEMPVSSLITTPTAYEQLAAGATTIRGIAWSGRAAVGRVLVGLDGEPWREAQLTGCDGRYARTRWELSTRLAPGEHVLCSRACDAAGDTQPLEPVPNLGGYANNAVHRIRVTVA